MIKHLIQNILALTTTLALKTAKNYQPPRHRYNASLTKLLRGITLDSSHARRDLISSSRGVGDIRKQGMFLQLFA